MNVRDAVGGGGWLVALVMVVAGFVGGAVTEKTAEPIDRVLNPASPAFNPCPAGWKYEPADDVHVRVEGCESNEWRVILDPFTFACERGYPMAGGPFRACKDVPGWPQ